MNAILDVLGQIPAPVKVGFSVTLGFMLLGILAKACSRGEWSWDDLHVGVEAMLATVSGSGVYFFELTEKAKALTPGGTEFMAVYDKKDLNTKFFFTSILILFAIACVHMTWEKVQGQPAKRFFALFSASVFGLLVLFAFIYFVKQGI
jgi:hypothetical protein